MGLVSWRGTCTVTVIAVCVACQIASAPSPKEGKSTATDRFGTLIFEPGLEKRKGENEERKATVELQHQQTEYYNQTRSRLETGSLRVPLQTELNEAATSNKPFHATDSNGDQNDTDKILPQNKLKVPPRTANHTVDIEMEHHSTIRDISDDHDRSMATDEPPEDECSGYSTPCSHFFGSPCNKLNKAPGQYAETCSSRRQMAVWEQCGNQSDNCFCSDTAAACCGSLSGIPDFSGPNRTIYYLNFTSTNLTTLDSAVFGLNLNLTDLKWLIVNNNSINTITNDSLQGLSNLERFELCYNQGQGLNPYNFTEMVNRLPSLKFLAVNFTKFSKAGTMDGMLYVIRHLNGSNLRQLFAVGGYLPVFYLSYVQQLHNLCHLALTSNSLERLFCCSATGLNDVHTADTDDDLDQVSNNCITQSKSKGSLSQEACQNFSLPSLTFLSLANNSLVRIPSFCKVIGTNDPVAVLPNLTHLSLSINAVVSPRQEQFECLSNLQHMALTGNPLKYIPANIFQNLPNLIEVDLRFTNVMQLEDNAFNHPTLAEFTIKSSNWFMDDEHEACCISGLLFNGTNLTIVDLSYNVFSYATKNKTETILRPLRTAVRLMMAEVGLDFIPRVITSSFKNLVHFDFRSNLLSYVDPGTFDNMTALKSLDLSGNHLANPRADLLGPLFQNSLRINLESNPFSCTCDILSFLDLYRAHRDPRTPGETWHLKRGGFVGHKYLCVAPGAVYLHSLESLTLTVQNCLLTTAQEIFIYFVCLLCIFGLLAYAVLYKYRWQVRYWLYLLQVRVARRNIPQGRHRSRFTAFVSYCKEDSNFVLTQVLQALERTRRMPLCIHERDFVPGKYISQNVLERMEESSHVLLVLSNNALRNEWCRFELFVAHRYCFVHRLIPVTILQLEPLRIELMDAHVRALLRLMPAIEWPGHECPSRAMENFWNRLSRTLGTRRRGR